MSKKINWKKINSVCIYVILYSFFLAMGFIAGMYFQQMVVSQEVGKILSYSNIDVTVNFNESRFVDELNNRFIPEFKEAVNQTLIQGGDGNSSHD